MQINTRVEEPTRELVGHAIHGDQAQFEGKLQNLDSTTLEQAVALAMSITGIVSAHVSEANPPLDEDLRTLAGTAEEVEDEFPLTADEVHRFLSQCVFGSSPLPDVFPAHDAARLPFMIAGNFLASYAKLSKKDQTWTDYLDQVEAAIEAAPEPTGQS